MGWYLWFRELVGKGQYPDTDYSYILLYVYEIINLPHCGDAMERREILLGLWLNYRKRYAQLDSYLPE